MATLMLVLFIATTILYFYQRNKDLKTTGRVHQLTILYLIIMIVSFIMLIVLGQMAH